ncbi:MAG: excinuclease ABC subunit UvrC [Candidatus Latescibacterota bacterium]|nr:excinuclease ABC subunit UvrC [Candidatus Latescibacterota bacterium]
MSPSTADHLSEDLQLKINTMPTDAGVYLLKRSNGTVIYVGKAKNLRNRVRSYFVKGAHDGRRQFRALVRNVSDLECIVTETEQEALILEATQIKLHKPRYNILLKDDKKYPFIRITDEPFPRIFSTRDIEHDGSQYLGPFSNVRAMHTTLDLMQKVFPVRSCDFKLPSSQIKICLEYHIKRCEGPCENLVKKEAYKKTVERAVRFLRGQNNEIIRELKQLMRKAADKLQFERAAQYRNQLNSLESMRARQKVVMDESVNRDVVGIARNDDDACCIVLEVREGRLLGKKHHFLSGTIDSEDDEIISAFCRQFYLQNDFVPPEIHVPSLPSDTCEINKWLSERMTSRVHINQPQRGPKAQMVDMAKKNAVQLLKERQLKRELKRDKVPQSIYALQRDLNLPTLPRHIAGIDISNFQGTNPIGSLVTFEDGKPKRSQYRYFKIREVEGPDDFASIHEVVTRHFTGIIKRGETLPDLLLIDGGKGQLSSALKALVEVGKPNQIVLGLAKRLEEIFLPDQKAPVLLPRTSSSLRLLQILRDEAHRFALKNHRHQRAKNTLTSQLDNIPGVGPKRRNVLLQIFGSVQRIKAMAAADIAAVPGFSPQLAESILTHLKNNKKTQ